ncbi:DNA mismatch repair protein MutS [Paracholeplasma manati]|uniref:DNA mismatch repair protein MutS n=1 Tax=Paracholeplasma manati TaxID=591373 RepID=A0ABT2Y6E0_9MOLU|nr:DNA mismatch repair protein MutS [Paracholeplasma manati]MCV2232033.1 DNA mismatch repair protein MutS [Paracholeplasma manati]MDG0888813.1 DNA mismatch repair protein MutS [Paracholeplasma manati]
MGKKDITYTPMMQQYLDIKKDYADAIVFFRLGDFYEMFFDDAILASKELEIALTGRDAGVKERVPMCGVPYHAVIPYAQRLIQKGYKIAIVEQVTEPGNGLVKREVVKLITPGMIMDEGILDASSYNYIGALIQDKLKYHLAFADLSTGDLSLLKDLSDTDLIKQILVLNIKELVLQRDQKRLSERLKPYVLISYTDGRLPSELLEGLTDLPRETVASLLYYLSDTQKSDIKQFNRLNVIEPESFLKIDYQSRASLELSASNGKRQSETLLSTIDHTITALGSRLMRKFMDEPSRDESTLLYRYDLIDELNKNIIHLNDLRESLKGVYDLRRITSRIATKNASGKDLAQLRQTLSRVPAIKSVLDAYQSTLLLDLNQQVDDFDALYTLLNRAIETDPPLTLKEGGLIKLGYHPELDKLKNASSDGKTWMMDFESREKERTGIKNLKVGYNRVFGYYIEISKGNLDLVKPDFGYERKQTLSTGERYVTPELKEKEAFLLSAGEKELALEYELFLQLRDEVATYTKDLQRLSDHIAFIDVMSTLAFIAKKSRYVRPILQKEPVVHVRNGRHPVVEQALEGKFVENHIDINESGILLITGPNMSGKSTYMRMLAQIVVLAQMGSFVPAEEAKLPIFDAIYTRIGASDDLSAGQSTFMVEMLEANEAIRNATKQSLLIFDEIGRGTATYDGMALAQAIIEYVHEKIKAITLFSTHYHELTALEQTLKRLKNIHVSAVEEKHTIVFLHKIKEGPTDKSYGINVAELAKLPKTLIYRADGILKHLEADKKKTALLNLFNFDQVDAIENTFVTKTEEHVIESLKETDINTLTPLDALMLIKKLQDELK